MDGGYQQSGDTSNQSSCIDLVSSNEFSAEKTSDAPGEEWLTNNEGNNNQNKLESLGECYHLLKQDGKEGGQDN